MATVDKLAANRKSVPSNESCARGFIAPCSESFQGTELGNMVSKVQPNDPQQVFP